MSISKKIAGSIVGGLLLVASGVLPLIPQDMELLFSYSRPCILKDVGSATTTQDLYEPQNCSPDGNAYISVFQDSNGNKVYVEIPAERYKLMGGKDGFKFNPTKKEYQTFFEAFLPEVSAALSVTGSNGSATSGAATSLTYSTTTATGDDLLAVCAGASDNTTGVTFNGDALTQAIDTTTSFHASIWYKANPFIGTANVVVSIDQTREIAAGSVRFSGADTASPIGQTASEDLDSDNSLDITSTTAGNIVLDVIRNADQGTTFTAGANQTDRVNQATGAGTGRNKTACSTEAAGGTITMSWTNSVSDNPAHAIAEIKAAATASQIKNIILGL